VGDVYNAMLACSAALTSLTGLVGMIIQNRRMSRIEREQAAERAAHLLNAEHEHAEIHNDHAVEWAHGAHQLDTAHPHDASGTGSVS
jgi:hypothetical protein